MNSADQHRTPPRRPWVIPVVLVAMVGMPIIEIWALIRIGGWIGFWPTLLVILVLTGVGGWLISREGRKAWRALSDAVSRGMDPGPELTDAVLVLLGGILLLLPGFLTDVVALVFLLPFTRALPRLWLRKLTRRSGWKTTTGFRGGTVITGETADPTYEHGGAGAAGTVIEGEIEPPHREH